MLEHFLPPRCLICEALSPIACCLPCQADLPWVPFHCHQCRRAVHLPHAVCLGCSRSPSPYPYYVPLLYQPPISQIITAFKLGEQEYLSVPLAALFVSRFTSTKPDVLLPVPSHPKRIWERGYNPALLIALQIGKALGIPVDTRALVRTRHTAPQRLQNKEDRQVQLTGAFEVTRLAQHARVAVVDDVVTTGATLRAVAEAITPFTPHIECWAIAESPHFALHSSHEKQLLSRAHHDTASGRLQPSEKI